MVPKALIIKRVEPGFRRATVLGDGDDLYTKIDVTDAVLYYHRVIPSNTHFRNGARHLPAVVLADSSCLRAVKHIVSFPIHMPPLLPRISLRDLLQPGDYMLSMDLSSGCTTPQKVSRVPNFSRQVKNKQFARGSFRTHTRTQTVTASSK